MTGDISNTQAIKDAPLIYRGFTGWPSYSPDGSSIVFTDDADQWTCHLVLVSVDDTAAIHHLTDPKIGAKRPSFHPNGNLLAFNLDNASIWILDLASGETTPYISDLVRGNKKLIHPCFAPDGQSIVVASYQRGGPQREEVLYRINPQAEVPIVQLTHYPQVCAGRPAVSPDNQHVIFAGHADGCIQVENQLWRGGADGSSKVLEVGDKALCHGRCPAYAPDGRWVAFVSTRPLSGPSEATAMSVWIVSMDGKASYKITDDSMRPTHMAWSP